jgi:serine/threonine-protein kinase
MAQRKIIGDRFEIGDMLGQGGMATVYQGVDTRTGETVAIKLLKPEIIQFDPHIVERFDREGEALRRLNHPNIVKVLATVEDDDQHYVIMEHVGGGDLHNLLDQHRLNSQYLSIDRVLDIALDLSDALTRAHRLKIIHRDIKPANVLMAEDGTPRLTDFGVAHIGGATQLTQTGAMVGTLAYLSPEACEGKDLDPRADIWAFGVMLYEMLTLRRPFDEPNTGALLTSILRKQPDSLIELRPDAPASSPPACRSCTGGGWRRGRASWARRVSGSRPSCCAAA